MASSPQKYRVNQEPRISANQLAEYALAAPSRRQTILRNAKYAPTYLVAQYSDARRAIVAYLSDDLRPPSKLFNEENRLVELTKSAETTFIQNGAALSIEAIKAFREIEKQGLVPKTLVFTPVLDRPPPLSLKGVNVSVSIDLISKNNGSGKIGGVLLQTSKAISSRSWRDEHSKYVGSLVWMLAEEHLHSVGKIDRALCASLDLFSTSWTKAPTNYKTRLQNLEASCSEINMIWDKITPPHDFEGD
jgi:hypothetical protein